MDGSGASPLKEMPLDLYEAIEEEYASQSKLLQEFTNVSSIDKAWTFKPNNGTEFGFMLHKCLYVYILHP